MIWESANSNRTSKYAIAAIVVALTAFIGAISLPFMFADTLSADGEELASFDGGSGSATDPYIIANVSELESFRDSVNSGQTYAGKYIKLVSDIDISSSQWTPIGTAKRQSSGLASGSNYFAGTFDGAGHEIAGLTITPTATQSENPDYALGLFGAVMGGTVKNLTLTDVEVKNSQSELAGGAVGLLGEGGSVDNVKVEGSVSGKSGIGGIVGRMTISATVSNCTNAATVSASGGTGNVGGIVGAAYYTSEGSSMYISGCSNTGKITGPNDVGGIAGLNCAFISDCKNSGNVIGSSYSVGGVAGETKNYGGISDCSNSAEIDNTSSQSPYGTGGIVGWVRYDGAAPAYGKSAEIAITNNTNSGSVVTSSGIGVGGIAGVLYSSGIVSGNENSAAKITGSKFIGGIVGNLQDQGASTLPSSIQEGAEVMNNVSSTPLSNMNGTLKANIAYNNDSSIFNVHDNGDEWVAESQSSPSARYATLSYALENARSGDTIKAITDTTGNGTLEPAEGANVTFDLNGHSVGFKDGGKIAANGSDLTIVGNGDLYVQGSDGSIEKGANVIGDGEDGATVTLKGGTYPSDVSEHVAKGYEVKVLSEPDEFGNLYEVVAADSTSSSSSSAQGSSSSAGTGMTAQQGSSSASSSNGAISNGSSASHNAAVKAASLNRTSDDFSGTATAIFAASMALLAMSIASGIACARIRKNGQENRK